MGYSLGLQKRPSAIVAASRSGRPTILEINMSRRERRSKQEVIPTRREALKLLGSGALLVAVQPLSMGMAQAADSSAPQPLRSTPNAAPALANFPLTDVRLLDGPFLAAQKRDEHYLLKLE